MAEAVGGALTETAFTAGMVSSFDILLGVPLEDVFRELPLDDDVRRALLEEEGSLGRLVADVTDFLLGRPEQATRSGLPDELLSPSALSALMWAVEVTATLAVPEAH